jgi:hypothetical protein
LALGCKLVTEKLSVLIFSTVLSGTILTVYTEGGKPMKDNAKKRRRRRRWWWWRRMRKRKRRRRRRKRKRKSQCGSWEEVFVHL